MQSECKGSGYFSKGLNNFTRHITYNYNLILLYSPTDKILATIRYITYKHADILHIYFYNHVSILHEIFVKYTI